MGAPPATGVALRAELRQMRDNTAIRVTVVEPGMTDTPFFDDRPGERALRDDDVARAVMFALEQRQGVDVNELLVRPTAQPS
jgi:NADP-dependent 3-hydroxy acid dehydrogenase YdfG